MSTVYVIGSLRNPSVPQLGNALRAHGYEAFEEWFSGGREADDEWQRYEQIRGRSYQDALYGYHAFNVFNFDKYHLDRADAAVMVAPAGKSAHLELGYMIGRGKPGLVLMEREPERWDVMLLFADKVCRSVDELLAALKTSLAVTQETRSYRNAPWNWDR